MDWRPIETAPRDGTEILVTYWPHHGPDKSSCDCKVAAWWGEENDGRGAWIMYASLPHDPALYYEPTHWMPLPEPPKE